MSAPVKADLPWVKAQHILCLIAGAYEKETENDKRIRVMEAEEKRLAKLDKRHQHLKKIVERELLVQYIDDWNTLRNLAHHPESSSHPLLDDYIRWKNRFGISTTAYNIPSLDKYLTDRRQMFRFSLGYHELYKKKCRLEGNRKEAKCIENEQCVRKWMTSRFVDTMQAKFETELDNRIRTWEKKAMEWAVSCELRREFRTPLVSIPERCRSPPPPLHEYLEKCIWKSCRG